MFGNKLHHFVGKLSKENVFEMFVNVTWSHLSYICKRLKNVLNYTQAHSDCHTAVNWSVKRDLAAQQGLKFTTTQQIGVKHNFPRSPRQQYRNKHIYELELVCQEDHKSISGWTITPPYCSWLQPEAKCLLDQAFSSGGPRRTDERPCDTQAHIPNHTHANTFVYRQSACLEFEFYWGQRIGLMGNGSEGGVCLLALTGLGYSTSTSNEVHSSV